LFSRREDDGPSGVLKRESRNIGAKVVGDVRKDLRLAREKQVISFADHDVSMGYYVAVVSINCRDQPAPRPEILDAGVDGR
jgi:hypothetical protein